MYCNISDLSSIKLKDEPKITFEMIIASRFIVQCAILYLINRERVKIIVFNFYHNE